MAVKAALNLAILSPKRLMLILILLATLFFIDLFLNTPAAQAAVTPVVVSLVPPVQFPAEDFAVTGARLSLLWGHQRNIYGLDLGVIGNVTDQDFAGIAVSGLANITHGTTTVLGLQLAGLTNYNTNKTNVIGLQAALGANINTAEASVYGLQLAAVNFCEHTDINGFQVGLYNKAQTVRGLQIGIVNMANSLHGIQIGLVNFNHTGLISVSPVINIGF